MSSPTSVEFKEPKESRLRAVILQRDAWDDIGRGVYDDETNKIPDTDKMLRDFYLMWAFDPACGAVSTIVQRMIIGHLGEYVNKDEQKQQWVREALEQIEGGWVSRVQALLSAPFTGFAVMEKQWRQEARGWLLGRLELLHPLTFAPTLMGTDWITSEIGPGHGIQLDPKTQRVEEFVQYKPDINDPSVTLPRQSCVYWPYDRQFREDTYGRSILRRARRSWFVKTKVEMFWNIYMEKYATGIPIVELPKGYWTDPSETATDPTKSNVDFAKDELLEALTTGKGLAYEREGPPEGEMDVRTDSMEVGGAASADSYEAACKYWGTQVFVAMLFPQLLLQEPEHGSRAQAETMMDMFLLLLGAIQAELENVIIRQIVAELLYWNFGPQEDYGEWQYENLTEEDKHEMAQIFSLVSAGLARYAQVGYQELPADEERRREAFPSFFAPMSEVGEQVQAAASAQAQREAALYAEAGNVARYLD